MNRFHCWPIIPQFCALCGCTVTSSPMLYIYLGKAGFSPWSNRGSFIILIWYQFAQKYPLIHDNGIVTIIAFFSKSWKNWDIKNEFFFLPRSVLGGRAKWQTAPSWRDICLCEKQWGRQGLDGSRFGRRQDVPGKDRGCIGWSNIDKNRRIPGIEGLFCKTHVLIFFIGCNT